MAAGAGFDPSQVVSRGQFSAVACLDEVKCLGRVLERRDRFGGRRPFRRALSRPAGRVFDRCRFLGDDLVRESVKYLAKT